MNCQHENVHKQDLVSSGCGSSSSSKTNYRAISSTMNKYDIPTSAISFVETQHGRMRREQRGIDKKDLQKALKYGTRYGTHPRRNGDQCGKYVHNHITYIVNEVTNEEITCYAEPINLKPVPVSNAMKADHKEAEKIIHKNLEYWTSNTVFIVDTSGSMRASDVWGTRDRLDAVWLGIALDFLAPRLESGEATSSDVLSIITLENKPQFVIYKQPSTWVLFNCIIDFYTNKTVSPRGHGPFLPSLTLAKDLLMHNTCSSCAVSLTFMSDGRPSDAFLVRGSERKMSYQAIFQQVEDMAKKFGRRLTMTTIGIGDFEDFHVLKQMAKIAEDFGVKSDFVHPSTTSSELGKVFTSVATSLTTTQTEMTDIGNRKQRKIRDVVRESRTKASIAIREVSPDDFSIYSRTKVVRFLYKEWYDESGKKHVSYEKAPLQSDAACFVALSNSAFGEGAERFAFRFYELVKDRKTIVGKPLVAKESRMILDATPYSDECARKKFVRTFCSTQQLARRLATEFNQKLDKTRRVDPVTPRISFLDCSVYQLNDDDYGIASVLVEEMLDHTKWHKWNSNNGYVEGMSFAPNFDERGLRNAFSKVDAEDLPVDLDVIEECDEEAEEEEHINYEAGVDCETEPPFSKVFTASEVAQAFSHFTYHASGRKRLVCDLQGVFDENARLLRLSDPVIHYHNKYEVHRRNVHGYTDRGRKGVAMFFDTHECGHLCRLVLRGMRSRNRNNLQSFPVSTTDDKVTRQNRQSDNLRSQSDTDR